MMSTASAAKSALDREIDEYVEIFSTGSFHAQRKAIDTLVWAGISSPRLYDVVASRLDALKNTTKGEEIQAAAWYAKTLALSGNDKYRPVLDSIVDGDYHKKLRKHAAKGLERLDQYIQWNPVISRGLSSASAENIEKRRVSNMLNADDYLLLRMGAKRVYHGHSTDEQLIDAAAKRLDKEWRGIDGEDAKQIDAIAWLIKVVGVTGGSKYKPLLQSIETNATHKKVRKYATKYLKAL